MGSNQNIRDGAEFRPANLSSYFHAYLLLWATRGKNRSPDRDKAPADFKEIPPIYPRDL